MASPAWKAQPNRGHLALVELEQRGKLHALITQNIDELHRIAGTSPERIIEVHGTMRRVMCWGCGQRTAMADALQRVRDGEADPACRSCGGILKSDTISFGQALVPESSTAQCSLPPRRMCCSHRKHAPGLPVAGAVPLARNAGARIVIMNDQPTPMDSLASALLAGRSGSCCRQFVRLIELAVRAVRTAGRGALSTTCHSLQLDSLTSARRLTSEVAQP